MKRALAVLLLVLSAAPAAAQDDETARLRMQLRTVTMQLRQAQDDQAAIQAQKISAEMERDQDKKQLAAAQAEVARLRRDSGRAGAAEADLAKVKDALNQATAQAQQDKTERDKIQAAAVTTQSVLTTCEAQNTKLLAVANEILAAYENFDAIDSIGAIEPFTKLKRVELQNLAQDYRDRVDAGAFDGKAAEKAAPPPAKN
jgi:chromosome segregation ATPase